MKSSQKSQKNFFLRSVKVAYFSYHALFPSINKTCRYEPTCSEYMLKSLEKYGALKGIYLSTKRLLTCNPISKKPLFDPVP